MTSKRFISRQKHSLFHLEQQSRCREFLDKDPIFLHVLIRDGLVAFSFAEPPKEWNAAKSTSFARIGK